MKRTFSFILVVLFFLPSAACGAFPTNYVAGSGEVTSQTFDVSRFDRVSLEGFGTVFISQGQTQSVSVQTDENILPLLDIRVQAGELQLGVQRGFDIHPSQSITFYVTVEDLRVVTVDGSGDINVEPIQAAKFTVSLQGSGNIDIQSLAADNLSIALNGSGNISIQDIDVRAVQTSLQGSGDIQLDGKADTQNVLVNGSGNYLAGDLETTSADLNIPGSAGLTVWASDELIVRVNGSGNIQYYGQPRIDQSGSGSGDLVSLGEK